MSNKKTWLITGAGRGMGLDFAKAALDAGHSVVATGRDPDAVAKAIGQSNDLLTVKLDVTSRAGAGYARTSRDRRCDSRGLRGPEAFRRSPKHHLQVSRDLS